MSQYAEFVEITREYALLYDDREDAMNAANDYCIAHGILEDILRKHRSQILGALLEEFDEKKYAKTLREEGQIFKVTSFVLFQQKTILIMNEILYCNSAIYIIKYI